VPDDPVPPDAQIERPIREYIAKGAAEGAMSA
jgi:hypothetical protein